MKKSGQEAETYTRFNIYDLGQVVLDDHRSKESFIAKYKFTPPSISHCINRQKQTVEKELEL